MKKHISLILIGLFVMSVVPFVSFGGAVVNTASHNTILVDGILGTDWTDGNYTVRDDPDGTGWGPNWHVDGLYFSLNATGINILFATTQAGPTQNQFNVFIDIDNGGNGLADYTKASIAVSGLVLKQMKFSNPGFIPDFVLYGLAGSAGAPWGDPVKLYKFTNKLGATSDLSASPGFVAVCKNWSYWDSGAWSNPVPVNYEAYIPFTVLYGAAKPTNNAEIRLFASMCGGTPGDVIPNQYRDVDPDGQKFSNYVAVQIADAQGDPQLKPFTVGWWGANANLADLYTSASVNEKGGKVILGLDAVFFYRMWYTDSRHDYMNNSDWPTLHYIFYNSTLAANDTEVTGQMFHHAGYTAESGSNDVFNYIIKLDPSKGYNVGDKFYYWITAGPALNSTFVFAHYLKMVEIGPLPPIGIGFIGNVVPGGGFKNPLTTFPVTIQIEQLWNLSTTDPTQLYVFTDVKLNYTINETGTWKAETMSFVGPAGTRNVEYKYILGPFNESTVVKFNIIVKNNNTKTTGNFSVLIIIPPPEQQVFYMTDPAEDEWGTYPTNVAFGGLTHGLFDILEFNVSANIYGTSFRFRLDKAITPLPQDWGAGNFSHPIFVVMVDYQTGGATAGVLRSYVTVESDHAWDYAFAFDGWTQRFFTPTTISDPLTSGHGITTAYEYVDGEHWFSCNVPEYLIDMVANATTWKYYGMVGSGDYNDFRNHKAVNEEWAFGGGDDSDVDPNYCDILVPAGGDSKAVQQFISSRYDVAAAKRVTLLAVGPGITFVEDITDPLVAITSPANASSYTWTTGEVYSIDITWTASDPDDATFAGLDTVKVYVNTVLVPEATGGSGTVDLEVGSNVIRVVATDLSSNFAIAEITVTLIDGRPTTTTPKPFIPGYSFGFLIIAALAMSYLLIKKNRK